MELKVLLELSSAREIIRVLQESGEYGGQVECETTSRQKVYQEGNSGMNKENTGEWTRVTKGYGKCARKLEARQTQSLPKCENRFSALPNLKESVDYSEEQKRMNSRPIENRQKCVATKKGHKVVVIGDSHARGCAAELIEHVGKSCEVVGFVKPRTGLEVITETATKEISKLTKKDVVVVWGGTYDIAKNAAKKGLDHMVKFVKQNSHTNIVIMRAPHRHDLSDLSCVNNEVKGFNRKLQKMMKIYDNTEILDVDINREYYTRHGLHMNISGREKMAKKISEAVSKIVTKKKEKPITLTWEDMFTGQSGGMEERKDTSEMKETEIRSSRRCRKQPVTRKDDFLWTVSCPKEV
jgi:hypothetical protein